MITEQLSAAQMVLGNRKIIPWARAIHPCSRLMTTPELNILFYEAIKPLEGCLLTCKMGIRLVLPKLCFEKN